MSVPESGGADDGGSANKKETKDASIILSKFNTVYRHSVLDILTHYAEIPTDPNPDNSPLATKAPTDTLNSNISQATASLVSSEKNNSISNVKLKSIDFDQLVISFKHPLVDMEMLRPIPFDRKCSQWSQVEQQLIQMAKTAAKARNLSHLRVSGISYPTSPFNLLLIICVLLLPFGYFWPSLLYDDFFAKFAPFMLYLKPYHNYIYYSTVAIHSTELYFFLLPRFRKYRVPLDYMLEWSTLTLLDGYESVKRFDAYVKTISPDDVYYDFTNDDYFL